MTNLAELISGRYRRSRQVLYAILLPILAVALPGWMESPRRVIYIVLGFSLIIFLHELGHFVVARLCSVKCLAFSIGIGPRLLGWRKGGGLTFGNDPFDPDTKKDKEGGLATSRDLPTGEDEPPHARTVGDTDYRLSWLPLGGYVRMLGQDDMDPTKISNDPHAFNRRPIWQRMCIVSAGVIMNVIFAAVTFSIIFHPAIGVDFQPAVVGFIECGSPADHAGLKMGDRIELIDDYRAHGRMVEFTDVQIAAALSKRGQAHYLTYVRPGANSNETTRVELTPEQPDDTGFLRFGVQQIPSLRVVRTASLLEDAVLTRELPVNEGGQGETAATNPLRQLKPRDRIVKIGDLTLDENPAMSRPGYAALYNYLQQNGAAEAALTIQSYDEAGRAVGSPHPVRIKPQLELRLGAKDWPLVYGLGPRLMAMKVVSGGAADKAGMKDRDIIQRVGDRLWPTVEEFRRIVEINGGNKLKLVVLRDGAAKELTATPALKSGKGKLEIVPGLCLTDAVVAVRQPHPEAGALNGETPMRITTVDGQPIASWIEVYGKLKGRGDGETVTLALAPVASAAGAATLPDTSPVNLAFKMDHDLAAFLDHQTQYLLVLPLEYYTETQAAETWWGAVVMGGEHTVKFIEQVYMTLAGLVRGTVSADNLHGIVGITKVGYDVQERGIGWLWYLLAIVSVNLAVANFLPLPIVDGGLFLLLILEKIRGRPLSLKVQSAIQMVGIVLLAGLFIFVTMNDIHLFGK